MSSSNINDMTDQLDKELRSLYEKYPSLKPTKAGSISRSSMAIKDLAEAFRSMEKSLSAVTYDINYFSEVVERERASLPASRLERAMGWLRSRLGNG